MDPIKILKRAWHILWNFRALWAFGLILALTVGGSTPGTPPSNGNPEYRIGANDTTDWPFDFKAPLDEQFAKAAKELNKLFEQGIPSIDITGQDLTTFLWILGGVVLAALLIGVLMTIARYVTETAVIRMVDEHEKTGEKPGVRQGFGMGWSRAAWRMFLISVLIRLPALLVIVIFVLLGIGVYLLVIQGSVVLTVTGIVAGIGLAFLVLVLAIIVGVILSVLEHFFWRACALEELGIGEALRRGFELVRQNWKSVGLMWLVMIGVQILWGIGTFLALILLIPVLIVTVVVGGLIGAIPTLLAAGVSSLFLGGPLPWVVGLIVGAPLFILVAFSPLIFVRGLELVYSSTVWTLTYREISALQNLAAPAE
jgi:hypothetical protein